MKRERTLVAGIGNHTMGDDAVGLRVIDELSERTLGEQVQLYRAGVDSFGLLAQLEGREKAILVDAVHGMPAGRVATLTREDIRMTDIGHSLHNVSLEHVLEMGQELYDERYPSTVRVVGIGIQSVTTRVGLTEEVSGAVEQAARTVIEMVESETVAGPHQVGGGA